MSGVTVIQEGTPSRGLENLNPLKGSLPNETSFKSPGFTGWRDRQPTSKPSNPISADQLNNLLEQKRKTLNACNSAVLPDGGRRLKEQIANLEFAIKENCLKESNKQTVHKEIPEPPIHYEKSLKTPLVSVDLTVSGKDLPSQTSLLSEGFFVVPNNSYTGDPKKYGKPLIWARPPESLLPNNHTDKTNLKNPPLKWAGPPESLPSNSCIDKTISRKPHIIWAGPPELHTAPSVLPKHTNGGVPLNPSATPFVPGQFVANKKQSHFVTLPKSYQSNHFASNPRPDHFMTYQQHRANNNYQMKNYSSQPNNYGPREFSSSKPNAHPIEHFQNLWSTKSQQHQYYGGRMTKTRVNEVQTVTEDAVVKLHKSLEGCPGPEVEARDPPQLESSLMLHQRQALAWLIWRETQMPPGGILADDMGLGKTLTMISLMLKQCPLKEHEVELESATKPGIVKSKGTLVVCPASLLYQWEKEVNTHCEPDALKVYIYHGATREKSFKVLATNDVVITTYAIVTKEIGDCKEFKDGDDLALAPTLLRIAWERVILDEAHTIKNPKAKGCVAVCQLRATYRWALTGTPIHNNLLDMYALLKFLRVTPFDELKVWKKWVDNKSAQGTERLSALIKSLLLRRTKAQVDSSGKALVDLPKKTLTLHKITLSAKEKEVYDKFYKQFKETLNNILLMKEAEKGDLKKDTFRGNQTLLFTLLLRLQQICNHLNLILHTVEASVERDPNDLADDLESLTLDNKQDIPKLNDMTVSLAQYKKDLDFQASAASTKVTALMTELKRICEGNDKCVVVSQWTSMLEVVATHVKNADIPYTLIQGSMPVPKRMACLEEFNDPLSETKVMLLSLKAGGVGLNLTGGNHLFLVDVHWNPALESQACDRVYRVGQKKEVTIHRFLCEDSVEEQILSLQKKKLALASSILEGGAKCSTGITLKDLQLLFSVK